MPSTEPEGGRDAASLVHVAVGVVEDSKGDILIAKRPEHLHQGGLWEFPGGKVEEGEGVFAALKRELSEEIGILIDSAEPLIQIPWHYGDKAVMLDVFRVRQFSGEARGREGQVIQWVKANELNRFEFPAANQGILNALCLPHAYMITGRFTDLDVFNMRLQRQLESGIRLVQLRAKHLPDAELNKYVISARALCEQYGAGLLLNGEPAMAKRHCIGLHLSSRALMVCNGRPLEKNRLLAASVHNRQELRQANHIGVDFVVISPVKKTSSHPHATPLGWKNFSQLCRQSSVPAYALGGMSVEDIPLAHEHGAQGIAAISGLWG